MNFSSTPYRAFKKLLMQINTLTMSFYSVSLYLYLCISISLYLCIYIYCISLHLLNTLFIALSYISCFISLSCQGIMFLVMSVCQLLR